jgi:hypothetical protein
MTHGIKSYFGGLGDTLQFSTLPEMFHEQGHEVFLTADAPFRNSSIRSIWDTNPFVKGQADVAWTLGDTPGCKYQNLFDDFIKNWEYAHGLIPKNSFPKIYHTPRVIDIIKSSYSQRDIKIVINGQRPTNTYGFESIQVSGNTLTEYIDLINCCDTFISLSSGPHMLAGSLRHTNTKFKQVCFLSSDNRQGTNESWYDYQMRTKYFILPLVEYIKI